VNRKLNRKETNGREVRKTQPAGTNKDCKGATQKVKDFERDAEPKAIEEPNPTPETAEKEPG
jgi:hypothetical protein